MTMTILRNFFLLASLAALALGIVWAFFKFFVPGDAKRGAPKWKTPAAAAGFFAVYTALIGLYVPLINREPRAVLVQETQYGSMELDVNQLFRYADSTHSVGVPSGYFMARDSSFYLEPPERTFWLTEADTVPSLRDAILLQQHDVEFQFGGFLPIMLGLPTFDSPKVNKFCAAEAGNRQVIYEEDSRINGLPVTFNPMTDRRYWRWAISRVMLAAGSVMSDSMRRQLQGEEISDQEIEGVISEFSRMWRKAPAFPRQHLFRNTVCVLSFSKESLVPQASKILELPEKPFTLMSFARAMQDVIPTFALGSLRDVVTSKDGKVLLARDPQLLEDVTLEGTKFPGLAVEQLYLLAVSRDRGYFVQVQYMIAPGQDLSTWRQVQGVLRSLRFVAER